MTTLKDIAKELGLSPATVSRALNGFPEVNTRTRALVEEAAGRLGYRPNQIAKKLVTGRSGLVGFVLKAAATGGHDPSFYEIMFGLSDQLARRDMDLVFHAPTDDDLVAPYKRLIAKNILDGFILNAPVADDPRIAFLETQGIAFVVHGRTQGAAYAYYDIDNRKAVVDAVHFLADLGHERIAFLNGPEDHTFARERARGFRAAMLGEGRALPAQALVHGPATEDQGYTAALALLSGRHGPAPSALICASTLVAAGVYHAAADLGLSIPGDLSVVAHDDAVPQARAAEFSPGLTVTRSPLRDACEPLAGAMQALLAGTPPGALQTLVPADLIARGSTGPAPNGEPPA
jgi:LacI family transcriptional regulator, galactose operon repressor